MSYSLTNEDLIATTIDFNEKDIILKSYLVNDKKNIDISTYENLINKNVTDKNDYQLSIFSDLKSSLDFIKNLDEFEKNFLEELDQNLKHNILLLSSNGDWIIVFES